LAGLSSYLNADEAAEHINRLVGREHVSSRWVRREAAAGRLPHVRLSEKKVLYEREELDRFFKARRLTTADVSQGKAS
jgi:hypothetical protein